MEYLAFLKVKSAEIPLGGKQVLHREGLDLTDFIKPSSKTLLCQVNAKNHTYALKKVSKYYGISENFIQLCPLVENAGFEEVTITRKRRK